MEEPNSFFERFLSKTIKVASSYQKQIAIIRDSRAIKHNEYINKIPFSDLKLFKIIFEKLPINIQLQISNSSPIRYAQLFSINNNIEVFCNRGTSGIDGSTSTAIGAAVVNCKPTYFITGDISFFYDSNALWNNYIPKKFKIILINNGGGGIFRILPGHQENETFNTYFETSHKLTAEHLAKMYGLEYLSVNNESQIHQYWDDFSNNEKPIILEVFTPEKENSRILLDYFKNLI